MTGVTGDNDASSAVETSRDQPKSAVISNDDDKEAKLARKLMHANKRSFSKPLRDKITRLLLFLFKTQELRLCSG